MATAEPKGLCVDLLVKDEIIYELNLRGKNLSGVETVRDLRKQLRLSIKNFELPDHKHLHAKLNVNNELETIMQKIKSLSVDIPDVLDKEHVRTIDIARLDAKLGHIKTRLCNLQYFQINEENKLISDDLLKQVDELHSKFVIVKNKVGDQQLNTVMNQLSESNIEEEHLLSSNNSVASSEKSVNRNQNVEYNQNILLKHSTPAANPPQNPDLSGHQNPLVDSAQLQVNSLNTMFAALPNPITSYLQAFKSTNGLNTKEILDFIKNTLKLKVETQLSDLQILNLITNFTTGPLLTKLLELKSQFIDIDHVHKGILYHFLSLGLREKLKRELVLRPQFVNEPLSIYIYNVKENAKILDLNYSEAELVQSIKYGISPYERAKLVFMKNPETFADLDQLVIQSHNVMYLDYERDVQSSNLSVRDSNLSQNVSTNPVNNTKPFVANRDKTCFVCNKKGHIAKFCRSRQSDRYQAQNNSKNGYPGRM